MKLSLSKLACTSNIRAMTLALGMLAVITMLPDTTLITATDAVEIARAAASCVTTAASNILNDPSSGITT